VVVLAVPAVVVAVLVELGEAAGMASQSNEVVVVRGIELTQWRVETDGWKVRWSLVGDVDPQHRPKL
jgi:hypothetical protein